jgi:hypothetical protein
MRGLKDVGQRWSDALAGKTWQEFEVLLADYFRRQGHAVEHVGTGRAGGRGFDGGIDLKLRREGRYVVVQCKHWNAKQVPHNAVHELLGIMVTESAQGAVLVTSGEFTPYAIESAQKIGNIELLDGIELRRRLDLPVVAPPGWIEQDSRAGRYADALVEAVADRIAGDSRRGRRRGGREKRSMAQQVAMQLLAFGAFLVFVMIMGKILVSIVSQPLVPQPRSARPPVPGSASARARDGAAHGPVFVATPPHRSAAEEAARKAEAERYLERVPELTHYRYSPLDADKDRVTEPAPADSAD